MTVKCDNSNRKCLAHTWRRLINVILILATSSQLADSLGFTSIQMPALVQRGTNFWLSCQYELSGSAPVASADTNGRGGTGNGEQLYSVKWYRNNEEFYRLILGGQQQQQQLLESQSNGPPLPPHQQQYFSQAGVNVLMSASNATHVRLLNASLESDGSYACEISTQNLSTIRHEKEIKVYVLPHLKLNLIGLRSLYSIGERVELNCLSDFSRPAGALGWFINGRKISTTTNSQQQQQEHLSFEQHFELAASTRHKSSEPKLSRASLTLKFKLTNELVRALAASTGQLHAQRADSHTSGNQSKLLLMKTARQFVNGGGSGSEIANSISGAQLFELLKLECRYKLTEVSDVTFNELRVAASSTSVADTTASHAVRRTGSDSDRGIASSSSSSTEASDLDEENLRRRRRRRHTPDWAQSEFELTKSHGTQVSQSVCPARRVDLLATIRVTSSPSASCHLGMLAREDPVILEPEVRMDDEDSGEQNSPQPQASTRDQLELPLGFTLSVNCSTLGALAPDDHASQSHPHALAHNQRQLLRHNTMSRSRWPIITTGDNDDRGQPKTDRGVYCSDPSARKRLLVSGRTYTPWRVVQAAEESQQQRRHHVAYVNLVSSSSGGATRKQQQLVPLDDKLSLSPVRDTLTDGKQQRKSLVAGQLHHAAGQEDEEEWQEEGPPPLLEWFINNQEAPKSNARYTPELPLLTTAPSPTLAPGKQLDLRPRGGATSDEDLRAQPPLPSIDYVEYFANFNQQRPVDQHLMLQLTLDKRHFMTPDSLLKLRCSSTQAQLLASDSLSISLMVLPQGGGTPTSQQNLEQQQQVAGSHWNQRSLPPLSLATGGGTSRQTQIESKYLHQYPRSSSQARQRVYAEQRHLAAGGQQPVGQMPPGRLASASASSSAGHSNQQLAPVCCLIISLVAILLQAAAL